MQGRHSALHIALDDAHPRHPAGVAPATEDPCGPGQTGAGHFTVGRGPDVCRHCHDTWSYANGMSANGRCALSPMVSTGCTTKNAPAAGPFFPPAVALYVVKLACERPDVVGRSLSQWDSAELARQLVHDGVVEAISPQTVQRILASHKLKPWRHHLWLSPHVPRDAAFAAQVTGDCDPLYTPLGCLGNGAVRRRENQSATPDPQSPDLGRPTGPTRAGRTRVYPQRRAEPVCWV